MSRPMYENAETLERENGMAMAIEVLWSVKPRKLPIKYRLDYAFMRDGRVIGFAELKSRKAYSVEKLKSLGGYMLSLDKIESIDRWISLTGLPVFLIVELSDGVYAAKFTAKPQFAVCFGGRDDRSDAQDQEPVGLIAMDQFKKLAITMRDKGTTNAA